LSRYLRRSSISILSVWDIVPPVTLSFEGTIHLQ
jgi:hypothetical protein